MMLENFLTPSARSSQRRIGPSGLGNPCDHCLADDMSAVLPGHATEPRPSGLAAIIGTGMHFFLEHLFVGQEWDDIKYQGELSNLECAYIDNYGTITGTADAYAMATVVDFKFPGIKKIKHYKQSGVPVDYYYQRQFYGRGIANLGWPVNQVANLFIPRDSNDPRDIWYDIAPFDPSLCDKAEKRANIIWNDYVLEGRSDELGSDDECYTCNNIFPNGEMVFDA